MSDSTGRPVHILLVDDDEGDVLITREAFEYFHIPHSLDVVGNGDEALQFLRRQGEFADAPRPDLVLLDLNLPRRNGLEVLDELKSDAGLRVIPVVVLTTSRADEDIVSSYSRHANAYVSKPLDAGNFMSAVQQIDNFFAKVAELPR